jgi:hypothetical protein
MSADTTTAQLDRGRNCSRGGNVYREGNTGGDRPVA